MYRNRFRLDLHGNFGSNFKGFRGVPNLGRLHSYYLMTTNELTSFASLFTFPSFRCSVCSLMPLVSDAKDLKCCLPFLEIDKSRIPLINFNDYVVGKILDFETSDFSLSSNRSFPN